MVKLKLQYFDHLMQRVNSLKKTLKLEKIEGKRRGRRTAEDVMVRWHHRLNGHEFEQKKKKSRLAIMWWTKIEMNAFGKWS